MDQRKKPPVHIPRGEQEYSKFSAAEAALQKSSSAGAPLGYLEGGVLLKDMKSNGRPCFGGMIFCSTNHSGCPIVCHAIRDEKIRNKTEEISNCYRRFNANGSGLFLVYEGSTRNVGGYTCFKFALSEGALSMREIMNASNRKDCSSELFTELVRLLNRYKEHGERSSGCYTPLCSISLDTTYMDFCGQIRILPLGVLFMLGVSKEYPRGYPMEVGTKEENVATDLYTAALLTYQVMSGCEYERPSENKYMCDTKEDESLWHCVERCMHPFASKRMTLQEVCEYLDIETDFKGINYINRGYRPQEGTGGTLLSNLRQKLQTVLGADSTARTGGESEDSSDLHTAKWYSTSGSTAAYGENEGATDGSDQWDASDYDVVDFEGYF
jgi:hypothetical protein